MIKTILCDIDGTVADNPNLRGWYDYNNVDKDLPKETIIRLVNLLQSSGYFIIFITGRAENSSGKTKLWLDRYFNFEYGLLMRDDRDKRSDYVIKKELYYEYIDGKYQVEFVLDDRNSVIDMWRKELGLTCLHVDYGDY